jgi:hypothetical protein
MSGKIVRWRGAAGPVLEMKGYTGEKDNWDLHPFSETQLRYDVSYMETYNHPGWQGHYSAQSGDRGGPWLKYDLLFDCNPVVLQQFGPVSNSYGHCQQRAYTASTDVVSITNNPLVMDELKAKTVVQKYISAPDYADMLSKGATAIARCEPTAP